MKLEWWAKWLIGLGIVLTLALSFYCLFLNHININEVGVAYNSIGGKVWVQQRPGWYLTSFTVRVAVIPTIPFKVSIPSEANVINTKIVRFNPAGIDEFVRLQGFSYFSDQSIQNILMGYAFSGKSYPFLDILQTTGEEAVTSKPLIQ
jgi:hypothetical protein